MSFTTFIFNNEIQELQRANNEFKQKSEVVKEVLVKSKAAKQILGEDDGYLMMQRLKALDAQLVINERGISNLKTNYLRVIKPIFFDDVKLPDNIYLKQLNMAAATHGCSINGLDNGNPVQILTNYIKNSEKFGQQHSIAQYQSQPAKEMAFTYAIYSQFHIKQMIIQNNSIVCQRLGSELRDAMNDAYMRSNKQIYEDSDYYALIFSRIDNIGFDALKITSLFGTLSAYSTEKNKSIGNWVKQNKEDRAKDFSQIRNLFLTVYENAQQFSMKAIPRAFCKHHYNCYQMYSGSKQTLPQIVNTVDANLYSFGSMDEANGISHLLTYILSCNIFGQYPAYLGRDSQVVRLDINTIVGDNIDALGTIAPQSPRSQNKCYNSQIDYDDEQQNVQPQNNAKWCENDVPNEFKGGAAWNPILKQKFKTGNDAKNDPNLVKNKTVLFFKMSSDAVKREAGSDKANRILQYKTTAAALKSKVIRLCDAKFITQFVRFAIENDKIGNDQCIQQYLKDSKEDIAKNMKPEESKIFINGIDTIDTNDRVDYVNTDDPEAKHAFSKNNTSFLLVHKQFEQQKCNNLNIILKPLLSPFQSTNFEEFAQISSQLSDFVTNMNNVAKMTDADQNKLAEMQQQQQILRQQQLQRQQQAQLQKQDQKQQILQIENNDQQDINDNNQQDDYKGQLDNYNKQQQADQNLDNQPDNNQKNPDFARQKQELQLQEQKLLQQKKQRDADLQKQNEKFDQTPIVVEQLQGQRYKLRIRYLDAANSVSVYGSFCNWQKSQAIKLEQVKTNQWEAHVLVQKELIQFKFVVKSQVWNQVYKRMEEKFVDTNNSSIKCARIQIYGDVNEIDLRGYQYQPKQNIDDDIAQLRQKMVQIDQQQQIQQRDQQQQQALQDQKFRDEQKKQQELLRQQKIKDDAEAKKKADLQAKQQEEERKKQNEIKQKQDQLAQQKQQMTLQQQALSLPLVSKELKIVIDISALSLKMSEIKQNKEKIVADYKVVLENLRPEFLQQIYNEVNQSNYGIQCFKTNVAEFMLKSFSQNTMDSMVMKLEENSQIQSHLTVYDILQLILSTNDESLLKNNFAQQVIQEIKKKPVSEGNQQKLNTNPIPVNKNKLQLDMAHLEEIFTDEIKMENGKVESIEKDCKAILDFLKPEILQKAYNDKHSTNFGLDSFSAMNPIQVIYSVFTDDDVGELSCDIEEVQRVSQATTYDLLCILYFCIGFNAKQGSNLQNLKQKLNLRMK